MVESDSLEFEQFAYKNTVKNLEQGNYSFVLRWFFCSGRRFYVTFQGLIYYFTGATPYSMMAINAFMAFWGSLTLTRLIYSYRQLSKPEAKKNFILFFLIFTPSVVFWTSNNLKEALLYWAICQIVSMITLMGHRNKIKKYIIFLIGVFIGGLLRPHIIVIWVVCVFVR